MRAVTFCLLAVVLLGQYAGMLYARVQITDVREIVRRTKAIYAATTGAELRFEQTGTTGNMAGTLTYAHGDKYRLEFPKETVVSNGIRTWTYLPQKNQVIISKATARAGQVTPNTILTSFPGDYSVRLTGERVISGHPVWVIECTPEPGKEIGDISKATLYIDKSDYRFRMIDVASPSLGTLSLKVLTSRYNPKIPDSRFNFVPPVGAKVIDLTK